MPRVFLAAAWLVYHCCPCEAQAIILQPASIVHAVRPLPPRESGVAMMFEHPVTLTLPQLRELCPEATGELAVVHGEAWSLLAIPTLSDAIAIPKGPAVCYTLPPELGVDFGVVYDFADVAGIAPVAPPRPTPAAFDRDVARRLQELRAEAVPLLWYVVEVSDPITGRVAERITLLDSGASLSTFVGVDAELGVRVAGQRTIAAFDGTELTSPWGHVLMRVVSRARKGPLVPHESGIAVQMWTHEELSPMVQACSVHAHRTATRAYFKGRTSLLGFGALAASMASSAGASNGGLVVHPVLGLMQRDACPIGEADVATATAPHAASPSALVPNEMWYETLVTNSRTGQSRRYTALVDTGSAFSAFPAAEAFLGALPGGFSSTEHSAGVVHGSVIGVLRVRILRRAHRLLRDYDYDAAGNLNFSWVYDDDDQHATVAQVPAAPGAQVGVEVVARLDAAYGILGLNTLAALELALHPKDGLVHCRVPQHPGSASGSTVAPTDASPAPTPKSEL